MHLVTSKCSCLFLHSFILFFILLCLFMFVLILRLCVSRLLEKSVLILMKVTRWDSLSFHACLYVNNLDEKAPQKITIMLVQGEFLSLQLSQASQGKQLYACFHTEQLICHHKIPLVIYFEHTYEAFIVCITKFELINHFL